MLTWNEDNARVNWTEDRLMQEIADLEMSLAEREALGDSEPDTQSLLLAKSLENRRRMLDALLGTSRPRALPLRVKRSS